MLRIIQFITVALLVGSWHVAAIAQCTTTWLASGSDTYNCVASGNVGIGTNQPGKLGIGKILTLSGSPFAVLETQRTDATLNGDLGVFDFYNGNTRVGEFEVLADGATDSGRFVIWTKASGGAMVARMNITSNGNIGIGTGLDTPTALLDVRGNVNVTGTLTGAKVIGAVYQDIAEWVPASQDLEPGTVVVVDSERSNHVLASTQAYDTRVAGIVSSRPGVVLGVGASDKEMIATTGRVRVRVDAIREPIAIGDLLVSSDKPGVAMKSLPMKINGRKFHQPGTIIGKALEPLAGRTGEILVLLSLQ